MYKISVAVHLVRLGAEDQPCVVVDLPRKIVVLARNVIVALRDILRVLRVRERRVCVSVNVQIHDNRLRNHVAVVVQMVPHRLALTGNRNAVAAGNVVRVHNKPRRPHGFNLRAGTQIRNRRVLRHNELVFVQISVDGRRRVYNVSHADIDGLPCAAHVPILDFCFHEVRGIGKHLLSVQVRCVGKILKLPIFVLLRRTFDIVEPPPAVDGDILSQFLQVCHACASLRTIF